MLTPKELSAPPDWSRVVALLDNSIPVFDENSRMMKSIEQCAQLQTALCHRAFRGAVTVTDAEIRGRAADVVLMGLQMMYDHSLNMESMWEMLNHKMQRHDQRLRMLSRTPGALDAGVVAESK